MGLNPNVTGVCGTFPVAIYVHDLTNMFALAE